MAASCSHWWHALVYFIISVVLAFIAVTTMHPSTKEATPSNKTIFHNLSLNASRALRRSGFHVTATLLQISPELFLSSPNSTTIFAIQDSAITNASLPPWLFKDLLRYHTSPVKLSMHDLLDRPQGRCFPSLLHSRKLAITNVDHKERRIMINHVLVSHPDLFLEGNISIHGVFGPFLKLDANDGREGWDVIQSPICDSKNSLLSVSGQCGKVIEWPRIIQLLSSNGYISFAVGLHSVLDRILEDHSTLSNVTIFAPLEFGYITAPSSLLERIVRIHILPQRFTYQELTSFREKALLRTLISDHDVEVTGTPGFLQGLAINNVEIVAADVFSSEKFVIHGIPQTLEVVDLA